MHQVDYSAILEKSIWDLLQYKKNGTMDEVLRIVMEALLKAEQKGFLGYANRDRKNKKGGNKRNGYRESGLLKGISRYFRIKIPRDRLGLFKPVFLELMEQENKKMNELIFQLYVKGLTVKDISAIVEQIYDKRISSTQVSTITNNFEEEMKGWLNKPLEQEYYAIYIDVLRIPVRRDTVSKEAFYIILGLRKDLRREIIGIYNLPEETKEGWREVIKDIKSRGVKEVLLFIIDEFKEIEWAILENFPRTKIQRCITHKKRNLITKVRLKDRKAILQEFDYVLDMNNPYYSQKEALKRLDQFINKWSKIYPSIGRMFIRKQEYFTYLQFPFGMRRMIYTNNWIESLNNNIKRTIKIRNSFPNPKSALKLVMFKCIQIEEHYMKYPITALLPFKEVLDSMLEKNMEPVL
ncbi:MAG: IS256 family transposase [Deltaproteobacteria bacterium]|nr:MAG: IS256 family transposase [Deltaproteobacteria bacterium]